MFYSRQLLLPHWQERDQLCLKQAKVLIIGVGGLGCPVASMLAGLGIGELHLADPDDIALHNLPRQSLFSVADVGHNKAQIAAQHLSQRNPFVRIMSHASHVDPQWLLQFDAAAGADTPNSKAAPPYFDLIIELSDDQASKLAINRYCQQSAVAYAGASAVAHQGFSWSFAPWRDPADGCLYCMGFAAPIAEQGCQRHGVFLPLLTQLASLVCQQVISLLLRTPNAAAPIFHVQMPSHHSPPSVRALMLPRDPHCVCCAPNTAGINTAGINAAAISAAGINASDINASAMEDSCYEYPL
jgi:molybdopterin/thiamine biosynthesis adenylyltransferase